MIRIIMTDPTTFASQKGQPISRNRHHVKPTQISAEQHLWDQLQKHTKSDALGNILTQLEKQPGTSNNNNNSINNWPFINNQTHEYSTPCKEPDSNQRKSEENNEHKISEKGVSVNRNVDHKGKDCNNVVRMRYGRII